ncbi:hypothetical protein Ciccas_012250 [Cichlidogyrus casuarinus]|uniref:Uncharacterized protein n=1 Tax=Cichlidogyrus casuarinus TaxID=1844966 RepID=A0ABD2PPN9_9PLAT
MYKDASNCCYPEMWDLNDIDATLCNDSSRWSVETLKEEKWCEIRGPISRCTSIDPTYKLPIHCQSFDLYGS